MERLLAELRKKISDNKIELPLLPEVAQKVISMTSDESSNAAQLSALIHKDQALAGNVLRITNSATYGGTTKIVSLQQAVSRLGFKLLREITLAASVQNSVFNVPGKAELVSLLWSHSLATSAYAKEIAKTRRKNIESAYICGLLHTIGKPVVLKYMTQIAKDLKLNPNNETILKILEQEHHQLGIRMAKEWNLPDQVTVTIQNFENFENATNFEDEVQTTALAHMCADELLIPNKITPQEISNHKVVDALNLYPEDIENILDKKESVKELICSLG